MGYYTRYTLDCDPALIAGLRAECGGCAEIES